MVSFLCRSFLSFLSLTLDCLSLSLSLSLPTHDFPSPSPFFLFQYSNQTTDFKDFNILMLGRLLGGIATSLLFSIFEAWLIRAHADRKLPKQCLGQSFSWAAFGNSIVAIGAGLMANKAAGLVELKSVSNNWIYVGGYLGPFDIALVVLVICGFLALTLWEENYGEESSDSKEGSSDDGREGPNWYSGLKNAFVATVRSRDILLCGLISSVFEGSMYIFVFMWTPSIQSFTGSDADLPFGVIFATFMVSCMAGSSLFSILIQYFKGEALCVGLLAVASTSMAVTALAPNATAAFCAMNVFEVCVGMYWPIMGTMKGTIVPEDKRAAIYNLYRIPLNFIVLFSLLTSLKPHQSFMLNCVLLGLATIMQFMLMTRRLHMNNMKDLTSRTQQEPADEEHAGLLANEVNPEKDEAV